MNRQRRFDLFLLLSTLLLAFVGQYYFRRLPERFWDGVFFYGLAITCLVWLLLRRTAPAETTRPSLWRRAWKAAQENPSRAWLLLVGLLAAYTALRLNESGQHLPAVFFWVLSIGLNLAAWVGLGQEALAPPADQDRTTPPETEQEIATRPNWSGRGELWLVAACTVLALALRLPRLGSIPYVISGDEAAMGIEALHVLEGNLTNPFSTGWLSHPTLYFFLLAGPIGMLGHNGWGLRLLSALAGAATIPILYLLARRLFNRRVALAGMLLMTASHLHIHFSRLGINNVFDPLWGLLAFLFLIRGMQEGKTLDFALSGLFLGLAQYFYMGGRLIPIILAVYLVLWGIRRPAVWNRVWLPLSALGSSFLLTVAPLLRFFILHPDSFMARIRMGGIIQSGWLKTEQQVLGKSALQLLWLQFRKSFLAFNFTLDPTSWYNAEIPYLDFLSAIFFVLGLVFLLRHWHRRGYLLVNTWFWLSILIGGMLIENPPSSPRFVIMIPAVCLTAALGAVHCLDLLSDLVKFPRPWAKRALALLLLVALLLNFDYYFLRYTPAGIFGGLNTEVGTRIGEYLQDQPSGYRVYFFGPPRMWIGYATIPFLAPEMEGEDIETPLTAPPSFVDPGKRAIFILLPEREGELHWIVQTYPQGLRRDVYGHEGTKLFVSYEVR